jgi:hypothetical protein
MKITKKRYLEGFGLIVILLTIVRLVFPSVAESSTQRAAARDVKVAVDSDSLDKKRMDSLSETMETPESKEDKDAKPSKQMIASKFFDAQGNPVKHRIYSVQCFKDAFPDSNSVQLSAALKYGVNPVQNSQDAERRKKELVYVGSNPYFYIDRLRNSIPYLVPRASKLLQNIGRNFYDSLQIKGIPLHKIIVTSVMRSKDDVSKLRGRNGNATQNSCHLYGTTFDVCYNRYKTIEDPDGPARHKVRNDTLKWVLSEVLNDMRKSDRCYIKYEVKQGCFHITAK